MRRAHSTSDKDLLELVLSLLAIEDDFAASQGGGPCHQSNLRLIFFLLVGAVTTRKWWICPTFENI